MCFGVQLVQLLNEGVLGAFEFIETPKHLFSKPFIDLGYLWIFLNPSNRSQKH